MIRLNIDLINGKHFELYLNDERALKKYKKYGLQTKIMCNSYLNKNISFDDVQYYTKPCLAFENVQADKISKSSSIKELFENDNFSEQFKTVIAQDTTNCKSCPAFNDLNYLDISTILNMCGKYGIYLVECFLNEETTSQIKYQYSLDLGFAHCCNLTCHTCRNYYITEQRHLTDENFNTLIDYASNFYNISVGCSGETFFNDDYKKILKTNLHKGKTRSITIFTNGTLMNKTNWNNIHPENKKIIKDIKISIDAACEETYKKTRNENLWNTLCNNIDFIRSVKNDDCTLSTTFTISIFNYKDIDAFVKFAMDKGFTKILFNFARPLLKPREGEDRTYFMLDDKTKEGIKEHIFDLSKEYSDFSKNIYIGLC